MSDLELRDNPYVGLRPFFLDDNLYFFGREQQTAELLDILHQHRFLGVVGSSGSGKSSLVRAGLLPGLLGGFLVQDRDRWRVVQMKPGDAPTANLAAGLLKAMDQTVTKETVMQFEKEIRGGHTETVLDYLAPRLESNANLFLLVDQFEEIFAFRGAQHEDGEPAADLEKRKERARRKAEAVDFVDLLLTLAQQRNLPIYVVLTMRTDFLGDCDVFYGLPEALNRGRYLIPRMTREQLRDAIECPALLLDAQIAPRLLDCVLNELGDRFDRLPVLQHALLRTWDEWRRAGGFGPVDLQHFESTGGLEGALDKDAENALKGLDIDVTARIFKRLTDTDLGQRRVRSPARISQLQAAAGADRGTVEAIVRHFEGEGRSFLFGSADGKPDDLRIDISHESLIRQWERLRTWVDQERQSRDQYLELVARSRAWADGKAALLWPPGLEPFLDWRDANAPTPTWADRYSTAADDYDSAIGYLDKSAVERSRYLAEAETRRRWRKPYKRIVVILEVLAGAALAEKFKLYELASGVLPALEAIRSMFKGDSSLFNSIDWRFIPVWLAVMVYLGACVWFNRLLSNAHHRFAFPKILRRLETLGGRDPVVIKQRTQETVSVNITNYAPTFRRYVGYIIDRVLSFSAAIIVVVMILAAAGLMEESDETVGYLTFAVLFGCAWLYEALQISSKHQATVGMRAMGIYRTNLNGGRLSFGQASKWWFFRLISYIAYGMGFWVQPFTARRQTFHDWLARSIVLRRPPAEGEAVAGEQNTASVFIRVLQVAAYAIVSFYLIGLLMMLAEFLIAQAP